ncbi:MAG: BLUF domain-containing protein [Hyphomonadaceae bacterium]|nr:BLUF domain-containing protein [Hyphomonadaceae bacterium]
MIERLIYTSRPVDPGSLEAVVAAVRQAALSHNAACHVTGVLAYNACWFLQALEGAPDDVARTFAGIAADRRHTGVQVVFRGPVSGRMFPDWSMAFAALDDAVDLDALDARGMLRLLIDAAQSCDGVRAIPGYGPAPGFARA